MKKIIALLLVASLLAIALVACDDNGDTPGGTTPDVTGDTPGVTTPKETVTDGNFDDWRGEDETSKNNGDGSYEAGSYDEANSDDWTDNY